MTDQIRSKRAKGLIAEEISRHIEDQKDAYRQDGDDENTAMAKALEQMGDPVEVGKQLDKIHRPKIEWRVLAAALVLCCIGIFVRLSIDKSMDGPTLYFAVEKQLLFIAAGFLLLFAVYFLDYSFIGRYPKIIWFLLIACILIYVPFGTWVNGRLSYLYAYGMLFIPAYGGIIYAYRKKGYAGIIKCLLFCMLAVIIESQFVAQSAVYLSLLLSSLLMLFKAVSMDWFGTSKRKAIAIITGWIPVVLFTLLLRPYQFERLCSMIKIILYPERYPKGYHMLLIRNIISETKLFGTSDFTLGYQQGFNNDYILTYVFGKWGIAAGIFIIVLFIIFTGRMVYISLNQKNSLGMFVGLGCSLVFAAQGSVYILSNLSIQIIAQVSLPFVSLEGAGLFVNFIVLGVMMSVFRNTNIIKEIPYKAKYAIKIVRAK